MAQRQAQRGNTFVSGLNDLVQRGQGEFNELKRDIRNAQHSISAGLKRVTEHYPLPTPNQALAGDAKRPKPRFAPSRPRQAPVIPARSLPLAKTAIDAATGAGQLYGVGRGVLKSVAGLANAGVTTTRLLNPALDRALSPLFGQPAASEQVAAGLERAGQYVSDFRTGQRTLKGEVAREVHKANVRLNPAATPPAASLSGELRRNFDIGANQGELFADVASTYIGGPGAKAVGRAATAVAPVSKAEYIAADMAPEMAEYMAKIYEGWGHHFIPRRSLLKAQEWLRSRNLGPIADAVRDFGESQFNVLRPEGITNGQFYRLHYGVDPRYHGGRAPKGVNGGGWSGRNLGFQRYDKDGRMWHGAPGPLKARVGGGVLSLGVGADAIRGPDRED